MATPRFWEGGMPRASRERRPDVATPCAAAITAISDNLRHTEGRVGPGCPYVHSELADTKGGICVSTVSIVDMNWALPPLPIVTTKLGRESRGGCVSIVSIAHRLTSTIGAENQEVGGNRNLSSPRLAEESRRSTYHSLA
jgi:hypothetical protein